MFATRRKRLEQRCYNAMSINVVADPSQNRRRAERTLAAAKSPAHESLLCSGFVQRGA
jgi:hypothetical protein